MNQPPVTAKILSSELADPEVFEYERLNAYSSNPDERTAALGELVSTTVLSGDRPLAEELSAQAAPEEAERSSAQTLTESRKRAERVAASMAKLTLKEAQPVTVYEFAFDEDGLVSSVMKRDITPIDHKQLKKDQRRSARIGYGRASNSLSGNINGLGAGQLRRPR